MSGELAVRRTEVPASFAEQMHMATVLADSSLLPAHLRGKPANVLVILQGARALDVSAFWALQSMHVIDGKLSMAAELMRALVIRAGHKCRVVERSMNRAIFEITRSDDPVPYRAEFTWDDAKAAKLDGKTNWVAYRKSMMVARATVIAVRDHCPDVMFGIAYTPEELGAETDIDGTPVTDAAGNVTLDADTVEPLTDAEVTEVGQSLVDCPLDELPAIWSHVIDRAAQFRRVNPGSDESLTDYVASRVAMEAGALLPSGLFPGGTRAEARALWDLANLLRLGDATVQAGGEPITLREYIKAVGTALAEERAAPPPAEAEVVEAEVVEEAETERPPIDTPHADKLRTEAAESWDDTAERLRAERKAALDELADRRTAAAEAEEERRAGE